MASFVESSDGDERVERVLEVVVVPDEEEEEKDERERKRETKLEAGSTTLRVHASSMVSTSFRFSCAFASPSLCVVPPSPCPDRLSPPPCPSIRCSSFPLSPSEATPPVSTKNTLAPSPASTNAGNNLFLIHLICERAYWRVAACVLSRDWL